MRFQKSKFEEHPEGPCIGTFVDWKEIDGKFPDKDGNLKPQIQASFDTNEEMEDGRPFRISFWFGESLNEKSNAYKFFKGMGLDPDSFDDDVDIDLDELIGRKANLMVEHVKNPNDGSKRAKITSITPLRSRGRAAAPAAAPEEERELVGAGARNGASAPKTPRPDFDGDE